MANIKSAIKRIRTTETKRQNNKTRISRVRTFVNKVEDAIKAGDAKAADTAFMEAQPELQRSNLAKNTIARKLSRLSGQIAVLKGKKEAKVNTTPKKAAEKKTATKAAPKKAKKA